MGAGTSKIPDLKNLSVDQLRELKDKIIPLLIDAKEKEAKTKSLTPAKQSSEEPHPNTADTEEEEKALSSASNSPTGGGKKRRKKTIKHRKKRMKKTGKK
jgi:hypothetical protein